MFLGFLARSCTHVDQIVALRKQTDHEEVDHGVKYAGIYNADGTLLGEISYVVRKYTGRGHCALCDITHGTVRRKPEWDSACATSGIEIELLHRDEATPEQLRAAGDLPAVVANNGTGWRLVAGPRELAACNKSPRALVELLLQ